ncbi:MAG: glucose-6-phosphate 1-dehydrogenase [Actinomycetes bacterium]|nr:MAG: glucose-6-phosphate 1-dehydrogenase [Actinomycetes bacterium]
MEERTTDLTLDEAGQGDPGVVFSETHRAEALTATIRPNVVVLFGATGDLSRRKLLPGLLNLSQAGLLPDFRVVGAARKRLDDDGFRDFALDACAEFGRRGFDEEARRRFAARLSYVNVKDGPAPLAAAIARAEQELGPDAQRLLYMSVPPGAALALVFLVAEAGLAEGSRIIMEKPFGTDLESSRALNDAIHRVFGEQQVFRIDHFLGKEAAQNILALRFANGLFEPIWNRRHIAHVQIDVPETLSVGTRGAYYEETGAYRDMVVTHLMQILAFLAMEPPTHLDPLAITEEKNKVFRSLRPIDPARVVRGQYEEYRSEPGVGRDSDTETLIGLRCEIDNWRWSDVPFYLRTGKRMAEGARIISIAFREPPQSMFPEGCGVGAFGPDHLTFDLDDYARLSLSFYGKKPGPTMELEKTSMQFSRAEADSGGDSLEAYERLIRDAMAGDHTLFTTADGIERLWEVSAPLLESPPPIEPYASHSWGPRSLVDLIAPDVWRLPFARRWRG